jgi:acylpyruvate hydrolase
MAVAPWWTRTRTVYAIGRNYVAHAHELNNPVPKAPFWFIKPASSIIGSGAPHALAPGAADTHHELELGVVIGRRATRVSAADAMAHVGGYCLALDMTDRGAQDAAKKAGKPWTAAKGWDTSCPVSDLAPADAVPDPASLDLWLRVNGEAKPRQHGSTGLMIFGVPALIEAVSRVHTLEKGDLLLTGTPEGVGPVVPGDVITAGIDSLGLSLTVPVVAAPRL